MKYRAKIYVEQDYTQLNLTTKSCSLYDNADYLFGMIKNNIEQVTGGHIEQYVYGIGWVVCEEDGE